MTSINTDKTTEYGRPYNTDFHDEFEVDFHAAEGYDEKLGSKEEWQKIKSKSLNLAQKDILSNYFKSRYNSGSADLGEAKKRVKDLDDLKIPVGKLKY